ncbi:ABC-ATPase domain-containing protein [Methanobacterium formicicum]|uniref:ABC transporter ATPase n=1 Tax=Methanobacterium formicicum (strain DSM 3637 / PP1) TaxID=1204725 RepID=K2QEB2_METFP|nr:ABC-ATPase domain-containing protein [Methanobacterium formicicum]EKF86431.1 ABC transporter ATPase [Methanobacterium formicicum DSM 3637]
MEQKEKIVSILNRIDGRGYKAYLDLKGTYDFDFFSLTIQHVQRDPFASPSRLVVEVYENSFPAELHQNSARKIALEDYISRAFRKSIGKFTDNQRGSGKSGIIHIDAGNQEILQRSSVNISPDKLEIRFLLGLPARGRRIMGREAQRILMKILPEIVSGSCFYENLPSDELIHHVQSFEDAEYMRSQLKEHELVAFIVDGAVLPRESGVSDRPLSNALPFKSPLSLQVAMETGQDCSVIGMGIPEGVSLIVGGGYHGKSTLLRAVELGVYNHIPGDGREQVVTRADAVKIRAEDGRSVEKVDVSSFIHNPPGIGDTSSFSTENASGSTSQAANIIESLEAGSKLLLFDEDTSATNFMIRDERMQRLVKKDKEPITPFIDRVDELYMDHGVSSVLVMGGSGDYFQKADTVIMMDNYQPHNVTMEARRVSEEVPDKRETESKGKFGYTQRYPHPGSIKPYKGKRLKLDSRGVFNLIIGSQTVDLSQVEQLVESGQTRAISYALYQFHKTCVQSCNGNSGKNDSKNSALAGVLDYLEKQINDEGLDFLTPPGRERPHNLTKPRRYEIAAAMNRLRTFKVDKLV